MGQAVTLARWIGTGRRPVTAGQVLRRADMPAAAAALGVDVPPRPRTMADVRALHRPWCAAVATGLLQVGGGWVTGGPALQGWPPGDADLLAGWLEALRVVCATESYPQDEDSVRLLALALLTVLGGDPRAASQTACGLRWSRRCVSCATGTTSRPGGRCTRPTGTTTWKLERRWPGWSRLLAEFGAVAGDPGKPAITPLGRWAAGHLAAGLPGLADPGMPVSVMIAEVARFSDEEQQDHVAWGWLAGRELAEAAREILTAAEEMSPRLRGVAVRVAETLDQDALPAWREMAAAPNVGPHARAVLAGWEQGPELSDADWAWLAVEEAAAALEDKGPDEALSRVWENMPGPDLDARLAAVRATGHPDADALAQAVAEFAASGAPRSIDQVAELKVSLSGVRPPVWRRVRLPVTATLVTCTMRSRCCSAGTATTCTCSRRERSSTATRSWTSTRPGTKGRSGSPMPWRGVPGRSSTPTTSAPAGSTRSRWSRRSRATPARTIPSAWRTRATPRSSTGPRRIPKSPSRSILPRSTASWPRSAAGPE